MNPITIEVTIAIDDEAETEKELVHQFFSSVLEVGTT